MADKTTAIVKESRLERHMHSKFAAKHIFAESIVQKVKLPTRGDFMVAYVVHESESQADADATDEKPEETRVVLIMGYSHQKEEWAPTVDALLTQWKESGSTSKLKLLTFDNRGVGHSDAPWGRYSTQMLADDVLALMDHLGWTKVHVVGISMGGMISQELALKGGPERIQSLTLMVTTRGWFSPAISALPTIFKSTLSSDPAVITSCEVSFLYPESFINTPIAGEGNRTMREVLYEYHTHGSGTRSSPAVSGALGQTSALIFHYVDDNRLVKIKDHGYPVLIIGAENDLCIDVSHAHYLEKMLAADHVVAKFYKDTGHAVFLQHIDEVASDLLGVIRRAKTKN